MTTRRNARTDFFNALPMAIPGVISALTITILQLSGFGWLAIVYFLAGVALGVVWTKTDKIHSRKSTLSRVALNIWIAWGALPASLIAFPFWYFGKFCSDRGWV